MKHFTKAIVIIAMLVGFGDCLPSSAFAEEKPITSSLGNPKIKLIGEMTLPSAINKIVFEKGKDGKSRIGKILTKDGFYSVDEKFGLKSLLDLKQWKTENSRWVFEEGISNDGNYALASILRDPLPEGEYYPEAHYIVNLKTLEKLQVNNGGGMPAFSENTIAFSFAMGVTTTWFIDLQGNLIKDYTGKEREAVSCIVAHKRGFFGTGPDARFFDEKGNVLKIIANKSQSEFRMNYDTGQVALHYCVYDESGKPKESKVGIYDWKGELKHEMTLPFDLTVDLGFSPDGRYVVVAARSGWVKLLDMENEKELWTREMKVGKIFYWHWPFPITKDAEILAVYSIEPISGKYMITVLNFQGELIGYIEINRRPEMEGQGFNLQFIPGTKTLVFNSDKFVNLYKIED